MTLTTKRNTEDKVWILYQEKIQKLSIKQINIVVGSIKEVNNSNCLKEFYHLFHYETFITSIFSDKCFDTKEELLKSLE